MEYGWVLCVLDETLLDSVVWQVLCWISSPRQAIVMATDSKLGMDEKGEVSKGRIQGGKTAWPLLSIKKHDARK